MRKIAITVTAIALAVSGCATAPPNTPGAGSGATYTPFVDMNGLDMARYSNDLAGCRSYSQQIDAGAAAMRGMIGGIILGALVGAAIGGNSRSANYGATAGGGAGLGAAGGKAVNKQETVIANCMAGRGYRVLDGATVPTNAAVPSPYMVAAAAPQPVVMMQPPVVQQVSTQPVAMQPPVLQEQIGQDAGAVEKLARNQSCHPDPRARLTAKGAGFDTYSVACANGDALSVRCEFGNCRVLR